MKRLIIKIRSLSIILFIALNSCTNEFCFDIYNKVESNYKKGNEFIELKKIFNFDWDTLFILEEYIDKDDFNRKTGLNYEFNEVPEGYEKYIFVKNNNVIKTKLGECKGYDFYVPYLKGRGIIKINSINSKFKIVKKKHHYILTLR